MKKNLYYYLAGYPAKIFAGYPAISVSGATLLLILTIRRVPFLDLTNEEGARLLISPVSWECFTLGGAVIPTQG